MGKFKMSLIGSRFCVPKVDKLDEYQEIDRFLASEEAKHGL